MSELKDFKIANGVLRSYLGKDENVVVPEGIIGIGQMRFLVVNH